MPVRVGDPVVGLRRRNRLAVGCPPYVCQNVLAFSSNLFGSITHRGGRPARLSALGNRTSLEGTPRHVGERRVVNRPPGGCVFGERSKTKTVGAENVLIYQIAPTFGVLVNQCVLRPRCRRVRRRNRPAVGCPPYVCQPVLAFSSNLFGSITHRGGRDRPRSSPSPLRGNCRRCRQRKVGNRPLGGYVFGERSKPKTVGRNTHR
ncbi:MAG: hypothetical protein LBQ66_15180 [Planctomycetaceae bacterium]|nr:hypothetical protein [Planctomycetaceae bacterium]